MTVAANGTGKEEGSKSSTHTDRLRYSNIAMMRNVGSDPFPYDEIADCQMWPSTLENGVSLDPQGTTKFKIDSDASIGSIGSCFATRVAAELRRTGVNYLVTEPGPANLPLEIAERYGYWPLSARFGNVYTTLQLRQLIDRALNRFEPNEPAWYDATGRFRDPFRPRISPVGHRTESDLLRDRSLHLEAVRRLFCEVDVLIVTLGLTDVWCSISDDAAFPRCPGRGIGEFDRRRYRLKSLDYRDNVENMRNFVDSFHEINPAGKLIVSVSPVHLAATTTDVHVVRASIFAKSLLRVTLESIARAYPFVDYFASFEIANLPNQKWGAYERDGRHLSERTIESVMKSFFENFLAREYPARRSVEEGGSEIPPCDEDELLGLIASRDLIDRE